MSLSSSSKTPKATAFAADPQPGDDEAQQQAACGKGEGRDNIYIYIYIYNTTEAQPDAPSGILLFYLYLCGGAIEERIEAFFGPPIHAVTTSHTKHV
jgi:hypothetical protein